MFLLGAGFILGLTIAGGGAVNDRNATSLGSLISTSAAVAQPLRTGELSYADVAERTMPAVVNISTDRVMEDSGFNHPFLEDPFFRRFFDTPGENNEERITRNLGSGVIISADGYILTNNHIVEKASSIRVSFQNNEEHEAEVIGADPQTDVALIKIDADDLPFIPFADSSTLRVGDEVMALGNPFGLGGTVTKGIVSALGRSIGLIEYEDLIQTDATINPGNSGGALVNLWGELVGMNTAILSRSGGSQGIGFAIPSNMAQRIMDSLREHGKVDRAWLGVSIRAVNQAMAEYHGLDRPRGVIIENVNDDTPAAAAGLEVGDIILSVDDHQVNSVAGLRNRISLSPVGHDAKLEILRDGREKRVTVELGALPDEVQVASTNRQGNEADDGIDGVTVRELTTRTRRLAGVPEDVDGVIVTEVAASSAAAREGLERGDVILEIAKESVNDLDDYRRLLQEDEDRPILLRVYKPQNETRLFMAIPR
ncbi:MAG: DegQ family serine endoprotease [bacterium]